ncbi:hypothetical protein D3C85_1807800 [compost metagenome]
MNVLAVRHIGYLSVAAHTEGTGWTLVDVLHLDFLPGQVWLTESVGEQLLRDGAVLLADSDVESFCRTMYHTCLGQHFA